MSYFELMHSIGLHAWDLPALAGLIVFVVQGLVHRNNQKKREDEFQKALQEKTAGAGK